MEVLVSVCSKVYLRFFLAPWACQSTRSASRGLEELIDDFGRVVCNVLHLDVLCGYHVDKNAAQDFWGVYISSTSSSASGAP